MVLGFLSTFGVVTNTVYADPPPPSPGPENIVTYDDVMNHLTDRCILYTSTALDESRVVSGDDLPALKDVILYFTTKNGSQELDHTVPFKTRAFTRDTSKNDDGDLFHKGIAASGDRLMSRTFYQMQDSIAFDGGNSAYYMSLLVYGSQGTNAAAIKWFYKITGNKNDFDNESYSLAKNESGGALYGRAVKNPSDRPEDNTTNGRNAWMAKLAGGSVINQQCAVIKGSPSTGGALLFTSINKPDNSGKTVAVQQSSVQDGKTWYYVARGNWKPPTGSGFNGYIYRNNKQYVMIDDAGSIIGTHLTDTIGEGWKIGTGTTISTLAIQDFHPPNTIVSDSPVYNHIKLPSDLGAQGSQFMINFNPALTDTGFISSVTGVGQGDVNTKDKNITIEAQLQSPSGPFVLKELIPINDQRTGSYTDSDKGGFGSGNDVYILEKKDLIALYGSSSVDAGHTQALVDTLVICAHKQLNAGWVSQFVSLKLYDPSGDHSFSETAGGIKNVQTQGAGVTDWTGTQLLYTLNAEQSRKCGSDDDKSVPAQLLNDPAAAAGNAMKELILRALGTVGTIIQNFIIYVVSWAIGVASNNVPI